MSCQAFSESSEHDHHHCPATDHDKDQFHGGEDSNGISGCSVPIVQVFLKGIVKVFLKDIVKVKGSILNLVLKLCIGEKRHDETHINQF